MVRGRKMRSLRFLTIQGTAEPPTSEREDNPYHQCETQNALNTTRPKIMHLLELQRHCSSSNLPPTSLMGTDAESGWSFTGGALLRYSHRATRTENELRRNNLVSEIDRTVSTFYFLHTPNTGDPRRTQFQLSEQTVCTRRSKSVPSGACPSCTPTQLSPAHFDLHHASCVTVMRDNDLSIRA